MHQGNFAGLTDMGMGVYIIGLPMGGPAGMPDADGSFNPAFIHPVLQIADFAFSFLNFKLPVNQGNARRIISSVLQPVQAFYDNIARLFLSDVSYYSTHVLWLLVFVMKFLPIQ